MKAIDLFKFLSENKAQEKTLTEFIFKENIVKIGVHCSDFFITKEFELEEGQNKGIKARILVKCEEVAKTLVELTKSKEVSFEAKDGLLSLTSKVSIPIEKNMGSREQIVHNTIIIEDAKVLHWLAQLSLSAGRGQTPPTPYIDGNLLADGYHIGVANAAMASDYKFPIAQLVEWGFTGTLPEDICHRITLPSIAITKLNPELPIEIHIGPSMSIKSGKVSIKIEKLQDPMVAHLSTQFYKKKGGLPILFDEPENSSEPTRMERLVNWAEQTKTSYGEFLVSPSGIWIGPKGFVKSGFETNPKVLQLSDDPIAQTMIAAVPVKMLVEAIKTMGLKNVRIFFPDKEGDTFQIEDLDGVKIINVKAQLIEAPSDAIASLPIAELLDETPVEIVQGETTLVEAAPTIAEAIQKAVEENKVPEEMKESIQAAQSAIEESKAPKKAKKSSKKAEQLLQEAGVAFAEIPSGVIESEATTEVASNDFGSGASNAIVPSAATKLVEKAEIVENIDTNVVPIDAAKKRTAKALQSEVSDARKQLQTEIEKENPDPNRIAQLSLRIDTVGGRFIEIIFKLHVSFWPTLTISEQVKQEAKEAYPHLTAA